MKKQRIAFHPFLALGFLLVSLCSLSFAQADDYNDYVREVLEEERRSYGEQYYEDPYKDPEDTRKEQEARRQTEQDRLVEERKRAEAVKQETIRLQREAQFEAELQKMSADQKKLALKQKRMDSKIVRRVLKAASHGKHYAVLGLRNFEFQVGPFEAFGKALGPWTFFQVNPKHIKGAYRSRSKATHPDKNKDAQATEAFIAVEESATILSDERLKKEYDELVRLALEHKRRVMTTAVKLMTKTVKAYVNKMWWIFRKLVGPFAYPIVVLTALIV